MNKLYRYILVGIIALIPCFSNAQFTGDCVKTDIKTKVDLIGNYTKTNPSWYVGDMFKAWLSLNPNQTIHNTDIVDHGNYICFTSAGSDQLNYCTNLEIIYNNTTYLIDSRSELTCFYFEGEFDFHNPENTTCEWFGIVPNWYSDIITTQYTSLECQTEYNLIPISSVTAQYCKLNFDLISPTECPQSSGTGAVNRTAWYINNEQYPGTASLNIFIPEFIKYSTTYNENQTILDIEGYNADTDYIENVINNEKITPSNEDFTLLLQGLVNFIPYLFIGLLILRFVKILNKVWK